MGTIYSIRSYAQQGGAQRGKDDDLTLLVQRAFDRVEELNSIFSDYLPESELNELAKAPVGKPVPVSADLYRILDLSKQLTEETDGAFDVTAGPLIRLWRIAKKNKRLPTPGQIERAKARTEGMLFDLGGIAKGYAADEVLSILKNGGFPHSLVAASGDIVVGDAPPGKDGWRIGIETLEIGADLSDLTTVTLVNQAISTSADTRQFIELDGNRYSHIVSTKTGLGLTRRIGASVIAADATTTDSHATALTLLGAEEGLGWISGKKEVEARIVVLEGNEERLHATNGFPKEGIR
jgi:thiamine biosynthesis lipoprotein